MGPHAKKCENSAMDRGSGTPVTPENQDFKPKTPRGPDPNLARSFGIIFSSKFQHPTIFVNIFHVFLGKYVFEKHEDRTFRVSPEPWGPRDPPYVQERQFCSGSLNESSVRPNGTPVMPILRSRKLSFSCLDFIWILAPA